MKYMSFSCILAYNGSSVQRKYSINCSNIVAPEHRDTDRSLRINLTDNGKDQTGCLANGHYIIFKSMPIHSR
jgi:hypothetical protein